MVINSIIQSNVVNSVIATNQTTKEQLELEQEKHYEIIDKKLDDLIERLGYIQSEYKKEYILENGLKIKNRRQSLKKEYICEKVLGFDVETYKGKCKLICSSEKKSKLNPSFLECIEFLFYLADNSNVYRFFYNIANLKCRKAALIFI